MGNILDVLDRGSLTAYINKAVLEVLVGEHMHVVGVSHLGTVNHECIRIDVGSIGLYCYAPYATVILLHELSLRQHLAVKFNSLGIGCLATECH